MDTSPWFWICSVSALLATAWSGINADHKRYTESPFPNRTEVFHRVVTCSNPVESDMVFQSETWACRDMKIDGHRLRYWYRVPDHSCADVDDNFDPGANAHYNDVAGLCRALLRANNIDGHLCTAFIHDPSCRHSSISRMRLEQNHDSLGGYKWELYPAGRGYMKTLRCMLLET